MYNDNEYEESYSDNFEKEFSASFDKEKIKFDKYIQQKLIISLIGDVNSGKSMTINALTGKKLSEVGAYAGLTKDITLYKFNDDVMIADTPGLQDIDESFSNKAKDFVGNDADFIILFFNAAVGVCKPILDTYHELKKIGKPIILVLNKIDIWYDGNILEDRNAYETVIKQIEDNTGDKVIPISSKKGINIEELNNRIFEILDNSGKELLFLKISKFKENQVGTWINGAAVSAFGIGVIPLPGADIIPLTALQVALALKIAYIYNCSVSKNDVMSLIASTVTGGIGKQLFKISIQGLKALGWLGGPFSEGIVSALAGVIAASITYGFGWTCNAYYKSGMTMDLSQMGEIYKQKYNEYFEKNRKVSPK